MNGQDECRCATEKGASARVAAGLQKIKPESEGDAPGQSATWDSLIGPFYDRAGAMSLLNVSCSQLDRLSGNGTVLRTSVRDGEDLYPSFQFGRTKSLGTR